MVDHPADEVVCQFRQSESPGVCFVEEHVFAGDRVLHVVVDVSATAGAIAEGFGHVGGDGAVLLSVLAGHHLEEGVPVGGDQGLIVDKVDFVLAVGVLVVRLVGVPTDALHAVHHVPQVVDDVGDAP